jgi:hypothetical protein
MKGFMNDRNEAAFFFTRKQRRVLGVLVIVLNIRALPNKDGRRQQAFPPLASSG